MAKTATGEELEDCKAVLLNKALMIDRVITVFDDTIYDRTIGQVARHAADYLEK